MMLLREITCEDTAGMLTKLLMLLCDDSESREITYCYL